MLAEADAERRKGILDSRNHTGSRRNRATLADALRPDRI